MSRAIRFFPIPWQFLTYLCAFLAVFAVSLFTPRAWATGGPENVLLVVNPHSADSLAIANHYAALRRIPASNLLFLDWDPKLENTDVVTFRDSLYR